MAGTIDVGNLRTKWTGDTDDVQDSTSQAATVVKKSFEKIKSAGSLVTSTFDKVRDFGAQAKDALGELGISAEDLSQTYGALKNNFDEGAALAELGAASLRVEDRFDKFAVAAGGADEIMAAFQKGVGGTASEMDAMAISSGLLQAGLVGDAAEMEKVTEIASRLGDQTSDVSSRIGEFSQLLKNQSIQLLDNFGISSGKVKERIKELQAETEGMTREQAFLTATFEQADAALAILGPRTDDHLTAMERQTAAAANLEVEIGQKLAPAYAKVADFQANMNAETAIAIKGFQKGFSTVVELSGGLEKAAAGFGKIAGKMGTSSAALGGLGLAIGALVLANEALQSQLDEMNESFDKAEEAGGQLGTVFEGLTGNSDEWGGAIDEVTKRLNESADEYDRLSVAGVDLGKVMGADSAFADVMSASLDSVNKEIVRGSGTYEDYIKNVERLNAGLKDNDTRLTAHIKSVFEGTKKDQAAADATAALTDEQREQALALEALFSATATVEEKDAARLTLTQDATIAEDALLATRERALPVMEDLGDATTRDVLATREMAIASTELTGQVEVQNVALATATAAVERRAMVLDHATRNEEAHREAALRSAEALEIERQAAQATAIETGNLAIALKDATEADIAKRFIGMLDPKKMGAEAYTKAITDIGLKSGIMDETSVRLATDMAKLADAVNENIIPVEDVTLAMDLMTENAESGEQSIEDLIEEFKKAPASITPVGNALSRAGDGMSFIAAEGESAAIGLDSFGESAKVATPKVDAFQDKLEATEDNLADLVAGSPWVVTVATLPGGVGGPTFGAPSFAGVAPMGGEGGNTVSIEQVTIQVTEPTEIAETFEGVLAWAGRAG